MLTIAFGRDGGSVGMRMITADNCLTYVARSPRRGKVNSRIDFEASARIACDIGSRQRVSNYPLRSE